LSSRRRIETGAPLSSRRRIETGAPLSSRRPVGAAPCHRGQVVVLPLVQQDRLDHGAGGDDAAHHTLHQLFTRRRLVAQLLGDGYLVAGVDQLGDVRLDAVVGHASQRDALVQPHRPRGQHHVADAGHDLGVAVEGLVEIAQPEEEDRVRKLLLDRQILAAHGS
jgi:hypothetical protein